MRKLSGEQSFREKYQNRVFIYLMDNETVKGYVNSYPNHKTRYASLSIIHYMLKSFKEDEPDFEINSFFKLSPVMARRKIWGVVQKYMQAEKYRTALNIKSYGSLLYRYANEEKGLSISWSKKHRIPNVKVREGQTPSHEQIHRLVACTTHLDTKAVFLLSYSSGLKGEAFINLLIRDYKQAKEFREELRQEFTNQLKEAEDTNQLKKKKAEDSEEIKELKYLIQNTPAIIKVTYRIYPKRFMDTTGKSWYPAFISRDAELMIDKYLREYRPNANDDEPLFTGRLSHSKQGQIQLSKWLKFNIKKFSRLTGELKNTAPSLLRRSFYNRLISGGMGDTCREYLMGHSLQVRQHYFDWDTQKRTIILDYLKCNFNHLNGDVSTQIKILKESDKSKDNKIAELQKQIDYFRSETFVKDLMDELHKTSTSFEAEEPSKKVDIKKIKKEDINEFVRLRKLGYNRTYENSTYIVMER